ncbi:MAG: choice-of-anchor D domain-containing protein [Parvibaculum sp.]|uniref:choice-of-anchor D domain-containing protein n=1 Tax=Alphaproteobacteria TaxID=28211 RepID=UPI0032647466
MTMNECHSSGQSRFRPSGRKRASARGSAGRWLATLILFAATLATANFGFAVFSDAQAAACTGGPESVTHPTPATVIYDHSAGTCEIGGVTSPAAGDVRFSLEPNFGLGRGKAVRYVTSDAGFFAGFGFCDFGDGNGDVSASSCSGMTGPLDTELTAVFEWDAASPAVPGASNRRMTVVYSISATGATITSASLDTIEGEIDVTGNGVSITNGDDTPSLTDHTIFTGDVGLGPFTRSFTINNTGTGGLTLGADAVSLSGAGAFTVSAQPATTVAASGSTTFSIDFTPIETGEQVATVTIANSDADEAPFTFDISGDPRGPTGGTLRDSVLNVVIANNDLTPDTADGTDFGDREIAAGALSRTFEIRTDGFGASIFGADAVSLTGSGAFSVSDPLPLQANPDGFGEAQATFDISFDPSAAGLQTATVTINSNIPGMDPQVFAIQGTGTDASASAPTVTTDAATLVTSSSVQLNATVSGNGATTTGSFEFGTTTAYGTTLATTLNDSGDDVAVALAHGGLTPGTTYHYRMVATNSQGTTNGDDATFTTLAAPAPEIEVSGNGAEIASGDATPATIDHTNFNNVEVAAGLQDRTFTIANTGDALLTLGADAVTLSGANAADFTVLLQPAPTVAASSSTGFIIRFDPSAVGVRSASVSIANDDDDEAPYTFAIQGTGVVIAPEIEVQGNGVEITSGDATPSGADDTDFGSADQTTGLVSRSFTVANTGIGALTLGAVSLTGSSDFTVTNQPGSGIGPGGSTSFTIAFDPSGLGLRSATVSIANDDDDEAPYTFAIQGTGVDGGSITLVLNVGGPDTSADFSSPTAELNTSLTTSGGTAFVTIPNVSPGTHSVSAAGLTGAGYGITSIGCDDGDSSGDTATATATIVLGAGETMICTFAATETRGATSTLIADFLGARNTFLLANQPRTNRRTSRFGAGGGQSGNGTASAFGLSGTIPLPVDASFNGSDLSFASSYAWSGRSGLNAGDETGGGGAPERTIWVEGTIAGFNDANADGRFGVVYLGADQLIAPNILLGALVQFDWFSHEADTGNAEVSGEGWMAGPYATFRLNDTFFADIRAAWGTSRNDISPTGSYEDSFDTTRWLISGALTGSYSHAPWTVQPAVSLSYIRETQESYIDSLSVVIPEQTVSQGEVRAGPRLAYAHVLDSGTRLTPSVSFEGAYTFGNDGLTSSGSLAREVQGLRGRVGFGLDIATRDGVSLSIASHYDGIGTAAALYGLSLEISMALN